MEENIIKSYYIIAFKINDYAEDPMSKYDKYFVVKEDWYYGTDTCGRPILVRTLPNAKNFSTVAGAATAWENHAEELKEIIHNTVSGWLDSVRVLEIKTVDVAGLE